MKNKDQMLLEEAYKAVASKPVLFRDKKGNAITHGDKVMYNSKQCTIVGGKSVIGTGIKKDQIQIEDEDKELFWVSPKHLTKATENS